MSPTRRDILLAVALTAAVVVEVLLVEPHPASIVAALAILGLAAWRTHALAGVAGVSAAVVIDAVAGGVLVAEGNLTFAVMIVACLLLGLSERSPARVVLGAGAAVAAMTAGNQLAPDADYPLLDDLVFFALLLGAPAALGLLLRRRADLVAELDARGSALRAAREEEAAAAVAEERARVAIGVHDALAHRVGEISLQAAGARSVAAGEPERALEALRRIEDAGRGALDDIREVIGVLRSDDALALGPTHSPEALPEPLEAADPAPRRTGAIAESVGRLDAVLAAVMFLALAIETLTSAKQEGPDLLNVIGCAAIAAPLLIRRRSPILSAAGIYAACGLQTLLLTPPEFLVTPIALLIVPAYTVAAHLPRKHAAVGLLVCALGTVTIAPGVPTVIISLLAFAAGRAVRDRAVRAAELEAVNAELELRKDAHAARMRGEERLRIARELHDAVAHAMTVIVLQAGAAQRVWGSDPAAARVAVDALSGVARDTLAELRVTLRGETPARPDALEELVARVRPLGLDVVLERDTGPLPSDVEQTVSAMVQEALTNAARHAAPTRVRVTVRREDDDVLVSVADSGRMPGEAPTGQVRGTGTGLRGMAERVEAVGGSLRFGGDGPGFRVDARLPVRQAVSA